jgi:hypothetical protein
MGDCRTECTFKPFETSFAANAAAGFSSIFLQDWSKIEKLVRNAYHLPPKRLSRR